MLRCSEICTSLFQMSEINGSAVRPALIPVSDSLN